MTEAKKETKNRERRRAIIQNSAPLYLSLCPSGEE
jgi:hypothetical protein